MARARKAIIPETLDASLAALLTGVREAAGVTQVELARRLHQPQSLVAKIETCTRRISAVELLLVCRALGCDAGRLLADLDAAAPGRAKLGAVAKGGAGEFQPTDGAKAKPGRDTDGSDRAVVKAGKRPRVARRQG